MHFLQTSIVEVIRTAPLILSITSFFYNSLQGLNKKKRIGHSGLVLDYV